MARQKIEFNAHTVSTNMLSKRTIAYLLPIELESLFCRIADTLGADTVAELLASDEITELLEKGNG